MLRFSATTTTTPRTRTALLLLLLLCLTATTTTAATTCRAVTANYITHRLPQQCLRSGSNGGVGVGGGGGNYTVAAATHSSGFEQVVSTAAVTARIGDDVGGEGGFQTAIEASRPTETSLASSTISPGTTPTDIATPPPPPPPPQQPGNTESESEDSPLDTAKFLSFEEWKAQNLACAGQSSESFENRVREPRHGGGGGGSLNNALDSLGEDAEIEFDFGGEADGGVPEYKVGRSDRSNSATAGNGAGGGGDSPDPRGRTRSKNAGTTCKERFNYASFDCAATVHKTNPEVKGATSILVENKDSYMLNKCGAEKKFFIVELCDDILVDTVVLANFEFFSSMFRSFKVFVSDRYPIKQNGWKDLGTFEARNSRQVQAFLIENPLIWARYLKVEFLTQYGNEFYCPVSLLRVHGTTMMEEFKHQGEINAGGAEEDIIEEVVPEAVAVNIEEEVLARVTATLAVVEEEVPKEVYEVNEAPVQKKARIQLDHGASAVCRPVSVPELGPLFLPTCAVMHIPSATHSTPTSVMVESSIVISAGTVSSSAGAAMGTIIPTSTISHPPESRGSKEPAPAIPSQAAKENGKETTSNISTASAKPPDTTSQEARHQPASAPPPLPPHPPPPSPPPASPITHTHSHPPSAVPTTQESFFKTVHKRLSLLEANATLSLQYIEEQSRILRDAFVKVEKRQMEKTTQFIEKLNSTVLAELRSYKEQYDQLWQSTVIALESQNTHTDLQIQTLTTRLTLLTDELLFQRRIYQLQSLLLLLIVITAVASVVILFFNRGPTNAPAFPGGRRRLLSRHSRTSSQEDDPQTPLLPQTPTTPRSPLPPTSTPTLTSPTLQFSPPSPNPSTLSLSQDEDGDEEDEEEIEGTRSSPATPRGTRDATTARSTGGNNTWTRFGPRLKIVKDSGTGTAGGGGRWSRLPSPLGSFPAGGYASASASASASGSEEEYAERVRSNK